MQADQQEIYCLTADDLQTARHSPHLEMFREQNLEVLLMTDAIDDWLVMRMPEYQGKTLRLLSHGELEIPGAGGRHAARRFRTGRAHRHTTRGCRQCSAHVSPHARVRILSGVW